MLKRKFGRGPGFGGSKALTDHRDPFARDDCDDDEDDDDADAEAEADTDDCDHSQVIFQSYLIRSSHTILQLTMGCKRFP